MSLRHPFNGETRRSKCIPKSLTIVRPDGTTKHFAADDTLEVICAKIARNRSPTQGAGSYRKTVDVGEEESLNEDLSSPPFHRIGEAARRGKQKW